MKRTTILAGLFVVLALVAAQWLGSTLPGVVSAQGPEGELEIPFLEQWSGSGHADAEAEAFTHWDEDDPAVVAVACAKCHSTPGYRDFLGADGSEPGVVDEAPPVGTTVECVACHNEVTLTKDSVVMPSGIEITGLGDESRCMECHQGRESTISVTEAISSAGVTDDDTVSEDLGFLNIHYFAAAATKYGTQAKGGFEYDGKSYDGNFAHVDGFNTCIGCHNMHTLEVKVEACSECHTGVTDVEDLKDVRMPSSAVDYDGDGDVEEGIFYEIQGLQEILYAAMQDYAANVVGTPIAYNAASHPYFFIDTDENGEADEDESVRDNAYNAWTPRLVKAAYNYQVSIKDPGEFAHGGKYIIQLLYDSIEDLDPELVAGLTRIDAGHFAGSEEAFRHWDEDGEVPGSCAKCHSTAGLPTFLKEGVTISEPLPNGFQCTTCHDSLPEFTRYTVDEVEFPSGAVLSFGEGVDSNLCLECHQGRESKYSVDALLLGLDPDVVSTLSAEELLETVSEATEKLDDDTVADSLRFLNIHYFAAGATKFGTEAKGAYEYDGKEYLGLFKHVPSHLACVDCHSTHGLQVKVEECGACHTGVESEEDLKAIRITPTDWDGDGDTTEGIAGEIATMYEALYEGMQEYATDVVGTDIVYNAARYPYWFTEDEEQYNTWTPRLLRAAYNYQYVTKDPGAFAHNGKYIIQVLYDTLEDMGVDVSGMTRPE
jgi:cytochrome c1/nitrate reductase cytochrome c-type subunit